MNNSPNQQVVSTSEWVWTFLISVIPLVNIIMLFVWAFSSSTNENKANWAKAALIWVAIITVFYIGIFVLLGAAFLSSAGSYEDF